MKKGPRLVRVLPPVPAHRRRVSRATERGAERDMRMENRPGSVLRDPSPRSARQVPFTRETSVFVTPATVCVPFFRRTKCQTHQGHVLNKSNIKSAACISSGYSFMLLSLQQTTTCQSTGTRSTANVKTGPLSSAKISAIDSISRKFNFNFIGSTLS